jgi:hypothetical protein
VQPISQTNIFVWINSLLSRATLLLLLCAAPLAQAPMKTYQHSTGITFQYPAQWELREQQEQLFLLPGDLEKNAQGQPIELLLMGAQEAEGVTSPTDARVAEFFAGQLRQLVPTLKQMGVAETLNTGLGKAAVFTFEGADTQGLEMRVKVFVTLYEGSGIFLTHLAPKKSAGKREAQTRSIFTSLRQGPRQVDAALVGTWRRSQYIRTSPGGSASMSNTTWFYYVFQADGTFAYIASSRTFGNTADLGIIANSSGNDVTRGRWQVTQNGTLRLSYDGKEEVLAYKVYRNGVDIGPPGAKPTFYDRYAQ